MGLFIDHMLISLYQMRWQMIKELTIFYYGTICGRDLETGSERVNPVAFSTITNIVGRYGNNIKVNIIVEREKTDKLDTIIREQLKTWEIPYNRLIYMNINSSCVIADNATDIYNVVRDGNSSIYSPLLLYLSTGLLKTPFLNFSLILFLDVP